MRLKTDTVANDNIAEATPVEAAAPIRRTELLQPSEKQTQWANMGQQFLSSRDSETLSEINALLKSVQKTPEDAPLIIGCLLDKSTTKMRGDDGFKEGIMEQTVEIHNFPANGNAETLNKFLRTIDPEIKALELACNARFTNALELPGLQGRSRFVKITLFGMVPTTRFINWVEGKMDTTNPLIDNLVFHRNFMIEDEIQEKVYGKLLADNRGKPMRFLFDLLKLCDIPRRRAEYLLKSEMLRSLESSPLQGKIAAVHLEEVWTRAQPNEVRKTFPIHYSDPKSRMRVFLEDARAAAVLNELDVRPSIRLDEGPAALTIEVSLQLLVPRAVLKSNRQAFLAEKGERALARAAETVPMRKVRQIDLNMQIIIQEGKEAEVRGLSVQELEDHLRQSFGGLSDNIAEIHLSRNDRNQVDFDGRQKSSIWIMDVSEQSNAPTRTYEAFMKRLKDHRLLQDTTLLASISMKGDATTTLLQPSSGPVPASGLVELIDRDQIVRRIEHHLMRVGPAYLPATTLAGNPLVWPGRGRTCTTMDELGPIGAVDIDDDICRVDVRSIFKEGEITSETLFECLLDLQEDGTIILYNPDDYTGPDGRVCFTMYHILKDIFSDERVKGGGDNAVDEEKNLNLPNDQLMIKAGADGVKGAGTGGQNTGAVGGNKQGNEISDADADPGAGDVISDAGAVPGAEVATGDADTKPGMGVMVGDVDKEPMQVYEMSKLTAARDVSSTSSVGSLSLIRHWASLTLLAGKQARLLRSINSRASWVAALQPSAGLGDDEEFGKILRILRGESVEKADYGGRVLNLLPAPENNVADSVQLPEQGRDDCLITAINGRTNCTSDGGNDDPLPASGDDDCNGFYRGGDYGGDDVFVRGGGDEGGGSSNSEADDVGGNCGKVGGNAEFGGGNVVDGSNCSSGGGGQCQPGQCQPGQVQPGQCQPDQCQPSPSQCQLGQSQLGQYQLGQCQPGQCQPSPSQCQPDQCQPDQCQLGQCKPCQLGQCQQSPSQCQRPQSAGPMSAGSVSTEPLSAESESVSAGPVSARSVSAESESVSAGSVSAGPVSTEFEPESAGPVPAGPVSAESESMSAGPVSAGSVSAGPVSAESESVSAGSVSTGPMSAGPVSVSTESESVAAGSV